LLDWRSCCLQRSAALGSLIGHQQDHQRQFERHTRLAHLPRHMAEVALRIRQALAPFAAKELAHGDVDANAQLVGRRLAGRRVGGKPGVRIVGVEPGFPFVEVGGLPQSAVGLAANFGQGTHGQRLAEPPGERSTFDAARV
jgi:hypothetical protein